MNKKGMLGNLIGGFIAIVIAIAMFPMIAEVITNVTIEMNNTPNSSEGMDSVAITVISILPIAFALAILLIVINIIYSALKSGGLIGGELDYDDEDDDDLNGDGIVDNNEQIIAVLEDGDEEVYIEPKPEVKLPQARAEKDIQKYKKRNRKTWKESNDESFEESETESKEKFIIKETESRENFKEKETFHKSKSVSETKLKKSRFD